MGGSYLRQNWLSYFWAGGIAIILSWALSGCRFGNHEVDPPSTGPFYYETAVNSIELCANFADGTQKCMNETNPSFLPNIGLQQGSTPSTGLPDLGQLPDPLEATIDPVTANQYDITDPMSGTPYFALSYDSQNNIGLSGSLNPGIPIFLDTSTGDSLCNLNLDLEMSGSLTTSGPFTTNTGLPLNGRMLLQIALTMTPQGSGCQTAVSCLTTPGVCDGNAESIVANYYSNFNNSSILGTESLANVASMSYLVNYQ